MAWQKGQSGNPSGTKGDKPWREALRRALARQAGKGEGVDQSLERVADKVVELALSGDIQAIKEIADRLDGKAAQSLSLEGGLGIYESRPIPVEQRNPLEGSTGPAINGDPASRH